MNGLYEDRCSTEIFQERKKVGDGRRIKGGKVVWWQDNKNTDQVFVREDSEKSALFAVGEVDS